MTTPELSPSARSLGGGPLPKLLKGLTDIKVGALISKESSWPPSFQPFPIHPSASVPVTQLLVAASSYRITTEAQPGSNCKNNGKTNSAKLKALTVAGGLEEGNMAFSWRACKALANEL